ncbi:MAG TPA: PQQ-dependent sugar dehydrogenase [Gaiellaceae bacterium]|nr:PQQ-dependent sugar dehydrogenase [Gaiellaceae bacterium]
MRHLAVALGAATVALLALAPAGPSARIAAPAPPKAVLLAKGLAPLTAAVAAPGERDRLYLVGRAGVVRVLDHGKLLPRAFLNVTPRVVTAGEMGLLSIAFDPEYAANHRVYAFYTDPDRRLTISRFTVAQGAADPRSEEVLLRVDHPQGPYHNGGQVAFGPDRKLYAGFGDGGYIQDPPRLIPDPDGNSQNLDVLLGKIVRLDVARGDGTPQIVAYGLRNPWRFSFTPAGDLVIGDVGWNTAEEVDVVPRGAGLLNFGWSTYEGTTLRTDGPPLNPAGVLTPPAYTYRTHVSGNCSITGGYVYRGKAAVLRGRYVFGDYCSGRVWSGNLAGSRLAGVRALPFRIPQLTTFGEGPAGELYAATGTGRLYRIAA